MTDPAQPTFDAIRNMTHAELMAFVHDNLRDNDHYGTDCRGNNRQPQVEQRLGFNLQRWNYHPSSTLRAVALLPWATNYKFANLALIGKRWFCDDEGKPLPRYKDAVINGMVFFANDALSCPNNPDAVAIFSIVAEGDNGRLVIEHCLHCQYGEEDTGCGLAGYPLKFKPTPQDSAQDSAHDVAPDSFPKDAASLANYIVALHKIRTQYVALRHRYAQNAAIGEIKMEQAIMDAIAQKDLEVIKLKKELTQEREINAMLTAEILIERDIREERDLREERRGGGR